MYFPFDVDDSKQQLDVATQMTMDNRDMPIRTMAATIWGEARGEPWLGKVAVASVIMNRAHNPGWWGKDIWSVCLSPHQFSCWWGDQAQAVTKVDVDDDAFIDCLYAARRVIAASVRDPTHGCDHYYAGRRPPAWITGKVPAMVIGRHKFFRLGLG